MKPEHEEKIIAMIEAYRANSDRYALLQAKLDMAREAMNKLERERIELSEELSALRKEETAFFAEVEAAGINIEQFKAEINEIAQKMQ